MPKRAFTASVAAITVAAGVFVFCAAPFVTVVVAPAPAASDPIARLDELLSRHADDHEKYVGRIGRLSMFEPPPPPPAPPPPPPPPPPAVDERDRATPKRPSWTPPPPRIAFAVGDEVWFSFPSRVVAIRAGETYDDLEVLEVDLPWRVRVRYRDREHEMVLFDDAPHMTIATGRP